MTHTRRELVVALGEHQQREQRLEGEHGRHVEQQQHLQQLRGAPRFGGKCAF